VSARPGSACEGSPLGVETRRLLNDFQNDFPLVSRPYAAIAGQLGLSEEEVLELIRGLQGNGSISRVGPVYTPNTVGASTLAAMSVPEERLPAVAELVNGYAEVNHNYQREHQFNLWFVVVGGTRDRVAQVLSEIERETGLAVLDLPMLQQFHINLGFDLKWT